MKYTSNIIPADILATFEVIAAKHIPPVKKVQIRDLKYIMERVRLHHHNACARWLCNATPERRQEADAAGYDVNRILRDAFDWHNGQIEVPKDAIKVLRNVPGADPMIVWKLVRDSLEESPHSNQISLKKNLCDFARVLKRLAASKKVISQEIQEVLNYLIVKEIIEE